VEIVWRMYSGDTEVSHHHSDYTKHKDVRLI